MAIMKSGKVIRSDVAEVKRTGRNTQGVTLAKPDKGDEILSIARNAERDDQEGDAGQTDLATAAPLAAKDQPIATTGTGDGQSLTQED